MSLVRREIVEVPVYPEVFNLVNETAQSGDGAPFGTEDVLLSSDLIATSGWLGIAFVSLYQAHTTKVFLEWYSTQPDAGQFLRVSAGQASIKEFDFYLNSQYIRFATPDGASSDPDRIEVAFDGAVQVRVARKSLWPDASVPPDFDADLRDIEVWTMQVWPA